MLFFHYKIQQYMRNSILSAECFWRWGGTFKKQDFSLPCSDGYPFDEFLISKKQLETCLFACRSSSLPNFARRNTGNSRNSTISHKEVSTLNDSVQDTALRMH